MYKKIKKFTENFLEANVFLPSVGILTLLWFALFSLITVHYDLISYYPESTYQILEKEVERMVAENDYTSSYGFIIDSYNNETNELIFSLELDNTKINATISNLNQENQTEKVIRTDPNKIEFAIKKIRDFIIISSCAATFTYILLVALLYNFINRKKTQRLQKTSA